MEYSEYQNIKYKEIKIDELMEKLKSINYSLQQETIDKKQLNPVERMTSK